MAARKRADPRYNVEHYRIKASQAALKKNPRIVGELMKELVAEVRRQAEKRGLVVTEGLSEDKRELELTIDPLALVQQRARERQDREHREERRKRERDALEKARGAIATPGGRDTTSW